MYGSVRGCCWLVGSLVLAGLMNGTALLRADDAEDYFEKEIRPLLSQKCVECHGPDKQEASLRLDSKAGWETGGNSGAAVRPGAPDDSILMKAVRGQDGYQQMPPNDPLSDSETSALEKWIRDGAVDPRGGGPARLGGTTREEARQWWAFQPVRKSEVAEGPKTAIDSLIQKGLQEHGLSRNPAADKRTLIRRVTYDLTGLPPTPEDVEAFLQDQAPDAFSRVVERLLASTHYGEHWGRHWLDLVRYADTAGENADFPLAHAWRYRNWVIDAINADQPYDQFLREQLAGDLIAAEGPPEKYASCVTATGYLALARRFDHDSDKFMHLTHEDGIDTLGKAFLGLTLGCARCHDHKYDAITSRDYYALYGIFESTRFAFPGCEAKPQPRDLVPLMPPSEWDRVVRPWQEQLAAVESEIGTAVESGREHGRAVQRRFETARQLLSQGEIPDGGESELAAEPAAVAVNAWDVILLSVTPLSNYGADTTQLNLEITELEGTGRSWNLAPDLMSDFLSGNPHPDSLGNAHVWCLLDVRNQPTLLPDSVADLDGKPGLHVWRNGELPSVLVNSTDQEIPVWTRLPARSVFVHPASDGNVAVGWLSPVTGRIGVRGLVRDAHPGGSDGVGWVLEHFAADVREPLLAQQAASERIRQLMRQKSELQEAAPKQEVAYAVVEGTAADTRMHLRGDPAKPGDPVPRRWLEVLGGTPLKVANSSGRRELADWVTSRDNPLTARVMVNRIWLHHFGRGLVATPNDFGTRGAAPTNPELLDWLAAEFMDSGWSLKAMHRKILASAVWQQSALSRADGNSADPTNGLWWRFERRRLSAEEIRDSLLAASGELDLTPGESHPLPPASEWRFTQHSPFGTFYETSKRSVYLIQIRNRRHPFLGLFDGADPNATTPQRQVTTVPTQALYFLNDPFFHDQADKLADRVLTAAPEDRVSQLFRIALQRPASDREQTFASEFLARYEAALPESVREESRHTVWAALTRMILASNEFLFVE